MKKNKQTVLVKRTRLLDDVPVIGWREWLSLPTLGVNRIKAKIDTGARTSAIHAYNVRKFSDRGAPHVSFVIRPEQRRNDPAINCVAEVCDERLVRSSNGHQEERFVVELPTSLGGHIWPIELTLADRDPLGFRMLLGREAVRRRFLVDPDRSFLIDRCFADVTNVLHGKENQNENRSFMS